MTGERLRILRLRNGRGPASLSRKKRPIAGEIRKNLQEEISSKEREIKFLLSRERRKRSTKGEHRAATRGKKKRAALR